MILLDVSAKSNFFQMCCPLNRGQIFILLRSYHLFSAINQFYCIESTVLDLGREGIDP
jgi:hypothetical protein